MTTPDSLARWAVTSNRLMQRFLRGAWAVHGGIWLGLLDDDGLADATRIYYETTDRWLDEDLTESGLAEWESRIVDEWFPDEGRVLVAAAGAGREVLPLVAMGYDVVGFDPSPQLVDLGNRLLSATHTRGALLEAPPDAVPEVVEGPFDAAMVGWGGISHIRGRDLRIRFLSELRSRLIDGAPLLVSFLHRDPADRIYRVAFEVARAMRRFRSDATPIELGDIVSGSYDHHFTFAEIVHELDAAGFTAVVEHTSPYAHVVASAT